MIAKTTLVPQTYHGWNACQKLPGIIEQLAVRNIMLIVDPFLVKSGQIEQFTTLLAQYQIAIFSEIEPEPSLALGERIVDFARQNEADLIIGIGGGSALDLAKLVAVLATHKGKVADYLNLSGHLTLTHKGLPSIMIPTTSGTGSEVTNISVLSLESSKDVIAHDYLLADIAILDPALTKSVPPRVTAATGIDALTHAVEAYLSINADPISDQFALKAIALIYHSLPKAYADGNDVEARTDMSYGSYLAGLAFFNAGVAGVHALAYPLGGQFHISHGESNALLLPYVLEYISGACEARLCDIGKVIGLDLGRLTIPEGAKLTIIALQQLVKTVNIPNSLQEFAIEEQHLEGLTVDALKQTRLLARSPLKLEKEDIFTIYNAAYNGGF